MFRDSYMQGLLTAQVSADFVEYSIQTALNSAWQYRLDQKLFEAMSSEHLGTYCQSTEVHLLFRFRMRAVLDAHKVLQVSVTRDEAKLGNAAVLGTANIEANVQKIYEVALRKGRTLQIG